ncbi:MAG: cupin domain-containing protein [Sphaerochaetaceae bacterium]|nr:cupin domain-containing protein [uncultured Sphaerochaeta sp.]MDC7231475.1 cupin domain-containing protein [Sphaerochaetaceae bacterium]
MNIQTLIEQLGLEPLPGEGGFFKRVHSFMEQDRLLGSVIYYLVTEESYSSLHYLSTDEVWFLLEGDSLEQLVLNSDGSHEIRLLGPASEGSQPLSIVRGGCWQGTKLRGSQGWALCATTMCPSFEQSVYRQGTAELEGEYPQCPDIRRFLAKEE